MAGFDQVARLDLDWDNAVVIGDEDTTETSSETTTESTTETTTETTTQTTTETSTETTTEAVTVANGEYTGKIYILNEKQMQIQWLVTILKRRKPILYLKMAS